MQVRHETQLIEPFDFAWTNKSSRVNGTNISDSSNTRQSLIDSYTLLNQSTWFRPIEYLTFNGYSAMLAVYMNDTKQIVLFDTKTGLQNLSPFQGGKHIERFPLKPCEKKFTKTSFSIKGLDFSPDGQRLAIGQTDCIIYIYKLPSNIGQPESQVLQQQHSPKSQATTTQIQAQPSRPTITGKFLCSSPITCLYWASCGIIFGTQDGKLKLISFGKRNSSSFVDPITGSNSGTTTISSNPLSQSSAAINNSVAGSQIGSMSQAKVLSLYNSPKGSMPLALAHKQSIIIVGFADCTLLALTLSSDIQQQQESAIVGNQNDGSFGTRRSSSTISAPSSIPSNAVIDHSCPPSCIIMIQGSTNNVVKFCCAGSDGKLTLYNVQWTNTQDSIPNKNVTNLSLQMIQRIELGEDVQSIDYSQVNEIIVVATISRLLLVKFNQETGSWQLQGSYIELTNSRSLTIAKWISEGTQLVIGTQAGSVELFQCNWSKQSLSEQLEICHIAKNRVRITDRARNLLATFKTQSDIKKVNVLDKGRNVIIWCNQSLLLACLAWPNLHSELSPWPPRDRKGSNSSSINSSSNNIKTTTGDQSSLKFYFDYSGFVLMFDELTSKLYVLKLGQNSINFSVKTSSIDKRIVSVRRYPPLSSSEMSLNHSSEGDSRRSNRRLSSAGSIVQQSQMSDPRLKADSTSLVVPSNANDIPSSEIREMLAYVANDTNSLIIMNLSNGMKEFDMKLEQKQVDSLEFSHSSSKLYYRDTSNRLYILQYKDRKWEELCIMNANNFTGWLPGSDILVTQTRHEISVWYDLYNLSSSKDRFDSRCHNINEKGPLLDLSLCDDKNNNNNLESCPTIVSLSIDSLSLSNRISIPLDPIKVRFHTELIKSVHSALQILELQSEEQRQTNVYDSQRNNLTSLWIQLLWFSIELGECQIALKAMDRLNYSQTWLRFMKECIESNQNECDIKLSLFLGNWADFERIAEPERVQSTYRRLNRWTQLLNYLTRIQQFRQRDFAEEDFRNWLLARGRPEDAAKLKLKASDLAGALELLITNNRPLEAAKMLIDESSTEASFVTNSEMLCSLAKQLNKQLIELGQFVWAAKVNERILKERNDALDLYLRGSDFESAISIAIDVEPLEKVNAMRETHANYLLDKYRCRKISKREASKAIDRLLEAGKNRRALEVASELADYKRAHSILTSVELNLTQNENESEKKRSKELSKLIGDKLASGDEFELAMEAYKVGKNYEKMIELCLSRAKFVEAFRISVELLHEGDKSKALEDFTLLAKQLAKDGKIQDSEEIYLKLLNKPNEAIKLEKELKNYERVLELVERYEPDQLESQLLLIARELESEGKLDQAERYMLRISEIEWTNVVRMYRLAGRWDQAFRVASQHCASDRDPLLIQLAYLWAKSCSDLKSAQKILFELKLFNPVLDLCCENRNFKFALDLCDNLSMNELDEKIKENVDIQKISNMKGQIISRQAAFLEQQNKFNEAEHLLVENGLLNDAVKMHMDNERYQDAIRVIEQEMANSSAHGSSEPSGQSSESRLVALLNDTLIECARRISSDVSTGYKVSAQVNGTLGEINTSLGDQSKLTLAQKMFLRAQRPDLAVQMYQDRGLWQEAVQVAQRFAPQLLEQVEEKLDAAVSEDLRPIVEANPIQVNKQANLVNTNLIVNNTTLGEIDKQPKFSASDDKSSDMRSFEDKLDRIMATLQTSDDLGADRDFSRLLESIAVRGFSNVDLSKQISKLEPVVKSFVSVSDENLWPVRLIDLSDRLLGRIKWSLPIDSGFVSDLESLLKIRGLLYLCLEKAGNKTIPRIEQSLLLTHFVYTHSSLVLRLTSILDEESVDQKTRNRRIPKIGSSSKQTGAATLQRSRLLANQLKPQNAQRLLERIIDLDTSDKYCARELVQLIAKLSLSLANFQSRSIYALYVTGLWLLVGRQAKLSQKIWTRLLEVLDSGEPSEIDSRLTMNDQLEEIRAWLLESLMDSRSSLNGNDGLIKDLEMYLSITGNNSIVVPNRDACLVSGISQVMKIGKIGRDFHVFESDWNNLLRVDKRTEHLAQKECIHDMKTNRPHGMTTTTTTTNFIRQAVEFIAKLARLQL